jgi:hypothetical protein
LGALTSSTPFATDIGCTMRIAWIGGSGGEDSLRARRPKGQRTPTEDLQESAEFPLEDVPVDEATAYQFLKAAERNTPADGDGI